MKKYLTLFSFVIINLTINAQETNPADSNPQVLIQTSSEAPVTGKPWVLTLIIDYPNPDEVSVAAPSFGSFSLERYTKSVGLIENRYQTVIDYRFIPNSTGHFILEAFAIICPSGIKTTEPLFLNITAETTEVKPVVLKLAWENVPSKIEVGERVTLSLWANSRNLQQLPHGFFMPEVPAGLILSYLQLREQEKADGLYAKFDLIPFEGNVFLPSRVLQFENVLYEVPALRLTVTSRLIENNIDALGEEAVNPQMNDEDFLLSSLTKENTKQRIIRLIYFYSVLLLVIFAIFMCLYLLLKKK